MRRFLLALGLLGALLGTSGVARAGDFDLDDDPQPSKPEPAKDPAAGKGAPAPLMPPPPVATIRGHAYSLRECLALADRNHPNLWAARARLAFAHGQLDEAKWLPWMQVGADVTAGILPRLGGTAFYNETPISLRNQPFLGLADPQPFLQFSVGGVLPLWTFGKISAGREAAEANVRLNEWEVEKLRQQMRMDVRRAYFGLMLARDAQYLLDEIISLLDKSIANMKKKLSKGEAGIEEVDRLRLELYREETLARSGEPKRGETYAIAALRFLTGVQTAFDIPDEPLKRPTKVLGPVVQYLTAARLHRGEVNQARSGVVARRALVDLARARLYPDIGIGYRVSYGVAPSATIQNTAWVGDPFNYFGYGFAVGARWNLDLLPQSARVAQAEAQLDEARAFERLALGGVAVEVENAYGIAVEAKTREEYWDKAEHRTRQWISTTQDSIDLGTKDERALLEPLRAYFNARVNHLYALMDFSVALSDLSRATGWDAFAPID
jgi:outer membrane protein TolC